MSLYGVNLYPDPTLRDYVQAKTHRRSRINKKWRKRYGYKLVPSTKVINLLGKLYAHPDTIDKIAIALERKRSE